MPQRFVVDTIRKDGTVGLRATFHIAADAWRRAARFVASGALVECYTLCAIA